MELSFAKCETILNTLPIGYYTGRRIGVSLDKEAETSFYSPMEDTIVISYPIIAERMSNMPEGSNEEEAVRSMLYHEVSHAVLTPQELHPNDAINIFEDERIESVLRNYYHNVNFRKQLYDIHGGVVPKATKPTQAFYNAVRFGLGTAQVQNKISEMIKEYSNMNRTTRGHRLYQYRDDIDDLYELITKEFRKDPDAFNQEGGEGEQKQMDSLSQQEQNNGGNQQNNQGQNGNNQLQEGEGNNEESNSESQIAGDPRCEEMTTENMKRMVGASLGKKPNLDSVQQQNLDDFQKTVEMIISNFNKKNSGGSGINAYSGVFNPRAVARKDYRFFERSMTTQGNNRFGTCHLNLIIDCSGSFEDNVPVTNGILSVLSEVERKNRNFSMDVVFINHELSICKSVRDRTMTAWGGNEIPSNMKQVLMDLQKAQTCNYNIVLFDGDAMCNNYDCRSTEDRRKRFGVFDMKQTTLITDPDNKEYIDNRFTSTKVVVTKNYTNELIKHITNALTIAFG